MADINNVRSSLQRKLFSNFPDYIINRQYNDRPGEIRRITNSLYSSSKDLYKKELWAHFGCVNAIEFSKDGELLFSGGDDRRVLMWKVDSEIMQYSGRLRNCPQPQAMTGVHFSNIFCLAVDDFNKRVISGSNDDQIYVHNYATGATLDVFLQEKPIFCLSMHPSNGNIFASAGENGEIVIYDLRLGGNKAPLSLAKLNAPYHSVMYNPCHSKILAAANSRHGAHLLDIRRPRKPALTLSKEPCMSVRWNSNGDLLLALRNLLPPALYSVLPPLVSQEFNAPSYYNACTMKSCCFAGDNEQYVVSGSDDFNVYMWKIPEPWLKDIYYSTEYITLTGHRSIVNQVRYNPARNLLASSGVEKVIKVWSPLPLPYAEGNRDVEPPHISRRLCLSRACHRSPGFLSHDYTRQSMDEDKRMIHFFDSLLQNELESIKNGFVNLGSVYGALYPYHIHLQDMKSSRGLLKVKKAYLARLLLGKTENSACTLNQEIVAEPKTPRKKAGFSFEMKRVHCLPEELRAMLPEDDTSACCNTGRPTLSTPTTEDTRPSVSSTPDTQPGPSKGTESAGSDVKPRDPKTSTSSKPSFKTNKRRRTNRRRQHLRRRIEVSESESDPECTIVTTVTGGRDPYINDTAEHDMQTSEDSLDGDDRYNELQ